MTTKPMRSKRGAGFDSIIAMQLRSILPFENLNGGSVAGSDIPSYSQPAILLPNVEIGWSIAAG